MTNDIFFQFVWPTLWQSALLAAVVGGVTLLLRERLEVRWRYLLWMVVLARLALPVLPSSPIGILPSEGRIASKREEVKGKREEGKAEISYHLPSSTVASQSSAISSPSPARPPSTEMIGGIKGEEARGANEEKNMHFSSLPSYLFLLTSLLWLIGALYFAFCYISGEIWLHVLCRRVRPINDMTLNAMLHECRRELRIRRHVRLYVVRQEIAAASCGVIFPKIILSERVVRQFTPETLRFVLLHELAHIKRFDPAVHFLTRLLTIFHWPNPVLWLTRWRLECEREHACDAAVLHKLTRKQRREYGKMVLTFASWFTGKRPAAKGRASAAVGVFPNHELQRRIDMIIKHQPSSRWHTLLGLTLLTTLTLAGLTTAKPAAETAAPVETAVKMTNENDSDIPAGYVLVRGKVVDADQNPVPNAKVYSDKPAGHFGESFYVSDDKGEFTFLVSEQNVTRVQLIAISSDETQLGWQGVDEIPEEKQVAKSTLTLCKARVITGTVTDADGKPVEGAYVGGSGEAHLAMFTKTDSSGQFRFPFARDEIDGPMFQVYAIKPGVGVAWVNTEEIPHWEGKNPPEKISNGPYHLVIQDRQSVQVLVTDQNGHPLPDCLLVPSVQIGEDVMKMYYYSFHPNTQFSPPVCCAKTDQNGLATFDWVPKKELLRFTVTAHAPDTPITLSDGTRQYFGESDYHSWNKTDEPMVISLPVMAKVKGKIVNPDGTSAANYSFFVDWLTQSRPAGGQAITTDRNGAFELTGNAHDVFDAHSPNFSRGEGLVFPNIYGFDLGDGSKVKELNLKLQKGTRVFGDTFGPDGQKIIDWAEKYHAVGRDISPNGSLPLDRRSRFGLERPYNEESGFKQWYEAYLPPGTYEFKIEIQYKFRQTAQPEELLGDTQTVTITEGQDEMRVDFHLKPVAEE